MWAHMLFVSSILLGEDAMYFVARLFEAEPIFGKPYPILVSGVLVSVVPVVVALWAACRFLRMGSLDAWGSVCGGMTSSSGLAALRRATDAHAAAVSYAASYAVASVLITIAGRLVIVLMG